MSEYGVTPTGFVRKPLDVILAEQEAAMRDAFGPGVIQTADSPFGQLNGVLAEFAASLWELAEDVHQSYDPNQAEGTRLVDLARIRLLEKLPGETDVHLRQAITNQNVAHIDEADFERALLAVEGVTWGKIYSNSTGETLSTGQPRNSVSVAAIGGTDEDIAAVSWQYIVPGITAFGNVAVEATISGKCRTIRIIRPTVRRVRVELDITKTPDRSGCPPPTDAEISGLLAAMTAGETRPANGVNASLELVRRMIESAYSTITVNGARFAFDEEVLADGPLVLDFYEIMSIASDDVVFA
ncbi:hypothetical protein [Roseibium alexandrii]|uniref:hypothetical protein n=1 Tax=Roseibium alexandrii TaxID=388408 RepID=UPI003752524B